MVVTLGQQYNVGEKPTVILHTYVNRHVQPPNIATQKTMLYIFKRVVIIYDKSAIEPYKNREKSAVRLYTFIVCAGPHWSK